MWHSPPPPLCAPYQHRDFVVVKLWATTPDNSSGSPVITQDWIVDLQSPKTNWLASPEEGSIVPLSSFQFSFDCVDSESSCYFECVCVLGLWWWRGWGWWCSVWK